jgi:hypothetical protein
MPSEHLVARIGEIERLGVETVLGVTDRTDLLEIAVGQDRLTHLKPLLLCRTLVVKQFGRGPMNETRLITSSSRIGSIGGLVTCAKFCLK